MGNLGVDERWVHRPPRPGTGKGQSTTAGPVRVRVNRGPRLPPRRPSWTDVDPRVPVAPLRGAPLLVGLVIGLTVGLLAGVVIGVTESRTPPAEPASQSMGALGGLPAVQPAVAATPTVLASASGEDGPWVALTFDDGPNSRYTPEVLALLQRYGAVATFCMVGNQIPGNEALIREVVAAGMALCSHTRTHDLDLPHKPLEQIISEIVGAHGDLVAVAGVPVRYYRAPGGHWSPVILEVAATHGMQPLGWSVDPRDWTQPGVEAILDAIDRQLQPGGVILLHDGGGNREQTLASLEVLLPRLVEEGYRFGFPGAPPPAD